MFHMSKHLCNVAHSNEEMQGVKRATDNGLIQVIAKQICNSCYTQGSGQYADLWFRFICINSQ